VPNVARRDRISRVRARRNRRLPAADIVFRSRAVDDMSPLARKSLAEFVGTAMLVAAVIGSGIAAQRLSPTDVGLQLFENTAATAAALVAIILALGSVSGAHLNPIVTLVDRALGGSSNREAAVYVGAQVAGGAFGAVIANLMFGDAAVTWSTHHRATGAHLLGEIVATFGLVLVVFGVVRSGSPDCTVTGPKHYD